MVLFDGYRKSLGEERPLSMVPGHLFDGTEIREIECLIGLSLYFFWDASLFDVRGAFIIQISHDEFLSASANDAAHLKQFEDHIAALRLQRLEVTG